MCNLYFEVFSLILTVPLAITKKLLPRDARQQLQTGIKQ